MGWDMSNILVNLSSNGGGGGDSGLASRVTALETTVGDASSGLVKDVDDLETTVGDASSGLVKDVDGLKANGFNNYQTSAQIIGKWGNDELWRYYFEVDDITLSSSTIFSTAMVANGVLLRYEAYYIFSNGDVYSLPFYASGSKYAAASIVKVDGIYNFKCDGASSTFFTGGKLRLILDYIKPITPENDTRTKKTKGGK